MMSLVAGLLTVGTIATATPAEARRCFDQGAYNRQMIRQQQRMARWQARQAYRNARWNQNQYGYNYNGYNRGFLSRFF